MFERWNFKLRKADMTKYYTDTKCVLSPSTSFFSHVDLFLYKLTTCAFPKHLAQTYFTPHFNSFAGLFSQLYWLILIDESILSVKLLNSGFALCCDHSASVTRVSDLCFVLNLFLANRFFFWTTRNFVFHLQLFLFSSRLLPFLYYYWFLFLFFSGTLCVFEPQKQVPVSVLCHRFLTSRNYIRNDELDGD